MQNSTHRATGADETRYPWYDSHWLRRYTRAKRIIQESRPDRLNFFVEAFNVFRTRPDFQTQFLGRVFDEDVFAEIKRAVASLRPTDFELHEVKSFGRFVVHNHPFFTELSRQVTPLVSELVGEPVEANYNFLSLYSALGVCPVHMDAPEAKYTLDFCIDQNMEWPIWFSDVQPWPESDLGLPAEGWHDAIKKSPQIRFTSYTLRPGQAVIFSGSSQWHYRDPIRGTGAARPFCDLLFLHFIPRGTAELVDAKNWARLFGISELEATDKGHD